MRGTVHVRGIVQKYYEFFKPQIIDTNIGRKTWRSTMTKSPIIA